MKIVKGLALFGGLCALGVLLVAIFWFRPPSGAQGPSKYEPVADNLNWTRFGGDEGQTRFVPLTQITRDNVGHLEQAWVYHTGALDDHPETLDRIAFQMTPILAAGLLIGCTPHNKVFALDPATGVERWTYTPSFNSDYRPANKWLCRSVVSWQDTKLPADAPCQTRIFMGTNDLRLIALDARTGDLCAGFADNGIHNIDIGRAQIWPGEAQITSAPAIVGDVVVVGTALSDNTAVAAPFGTVRAFDARSGAPVWSFDPIAQTRDELIAAGMDPAASPGHANVWSSISVDSDRGLVYLPTTSPSPDFWGGLRPGDNRYANSVVALDGATGAMRWHFQVVHHDVWDFDLPTGPSFVTLTIDGQERDGLVQGTKQGLLFVLDRETGDPLIPVEERPVPQNAVLGEALSPTQPFPIFPPPLVPNEISADDAWGLTPFDRAACRKVMAQAGPAKLYTPPDEDGVLMFPFTGGGINWGGVAIDQDRKIVIANMSSVIHLIKLRRKAEGAENSAGGIVSESDEFAPMAGAPFALERDILRSPLGLPCNPPPWGVLAAVDLASNEILWSQPFGTTRKLAGPISLPFGTPNLGGALVTASGLTFIGATMDSYLRAFDTYTGEEIWGADLPGGGQAGPMSYAVNGKQYVVIAAGGHAWAGTPLNDTLVGFALPDTE